MADSSPIAALMGEESLEDMLRRHRQEGIRTCSRVWWMSEILQRYANDASQHEELDETRLGDRSYDPFDTKRLSVNEIRLPVGAASGRQVMERFERSYKPRSANAERFGEVVSGVDKAMMAQADAEQAESAAFRDGPCIQGVSCVRWEYDTTEDPRGRLLVQNWPIKQVMWGNEAREINLRDRTWHRAGWWWPASRVREEWPDRFKDLAFFAATAGWGNADVPGVSSRTPWSGGPAHRRADADTDPFYSSRSQSFFVEREEWRELTHEYVVARPVDPAETYASAQARYMELAASIPGGKVPPEQDTMERVTLDYKGVRDFKANYLAATNEDVPSRYIAKRPKIVYKYAYVIGGKVMETGEIPEGTFTFLFMTGRRRDTPTGTRWIGLAEDLVPQQRLNNLLLMSLYKNLATNPKGVLVYEQGVFKNRDDALDQFTKPGGVIETKRGALTSGAKPYAFEAGGTNAYHGMLESLFGYVSSSIPRLAGFNAAALGQLGPDYRRISGSVVRQQADAAIQNNPELFDSWRLYRRQGGRLFLAFIATHWEGRLEELGEIVGEEILYTIEEAEDGTERAVFSLPPAELWKQDAWRSIDIVEVVPDDDRRETFWKVLEQGGFQMIQQPQYDTGTPLLGSLDIIKTLPGLSPSERDDLIRRKKKELIAKQQADQKNQQGEAQQRPPATSISFKDLPPDGQQQLAAQAGINLSAAPTAGMPGGNGLAESPEEEQLPPVQ